MASPRRRALLCAFSNTNQLTGASSKFRAIRGIENDADRLIWPIPHREVSAALEPVHCRFRVGSLRAAGLLWQTRAILATLADAHPDRPGRRAFLHRASGKVLHQRVERRRIGKRLQLIQDETGIGRAGSCGKLQHESSPAGDISREGGKRRSQSPYQCNRCRYGGPEERPLPPLPEAARVQADD